MESGWRYARFFFQDAVKRIGSVIEYARKGYPDLFDSVKSNRRNTPQASYRYIVGRIMKDKYNELAALCGYDPGKIREMERAPISDYYLILDRRVEENRREAAAAKRSR